MVVLHNAESGEGCQTECEELSKKDNLFFF